MDDTAHEMASNAQLSEIRELKALLCDLCTRLEQRGDGLLEKVMKTYRFHIVAEIADKIEGCFLQVSFFSEVISEEAETAEKALSACLRRVEEHGHLANKAMIEKQEREIKEIEATYGALRAMRQAPLRTGISVKSVCQLID